MKDQISLPIKKNSSWRNSVNGQMDSGKRMEERETEENNMKTRH